MCLCCSFECLSNFPPFNLLPHHFTFLLGGDRDRRRGAGDMASIAVPDPTPPPALDAENIRKAVQGTQLTTTLSSFSFSFSFLCKPRGGLVDRDLCFIFYFFSLLCIPFFACFEKDLVSSFETLHFSLLIFFIRKYFTPFFLRFLND